MANLNDVLRDVLEKDFDKDTVDRALDEGDETDEEKREHTADSQEESEAGYVGPDMAEYHSVGRGTVENWIKNSIYEKYNISNEDMRAFSKMSPIDMMSDFGKTVGDIGRLREGLRTGQLSSAEYKSALSKTKGEIVGKMLEMGSSRKSILEDVFLRSVGVTPADTANIHSFRDLVDILRSDEMDPVDTELSPDRERPEPDMQDMEISPDTDPAMNLENLEVDKEQMEQETDKEPEHDSLQDLLLLENNEEIADLLAGKVIEANEKRKKIQRECYEQMKQEAERRIAAGDKILVLYAPFAPSGVVGLIAGDLKEEYHRPCIVFAPKSDGTGQVIWCGSGRSIKAYHLLNGLNRCSDLFLHYGGHELAAGMSISADETMLEELRARLNEDASYLTEEDMQPVRQWDIAITEMDLTEELYEEMNCLEPFGTGVERPIFKMTLHVKSKNNKSYEIMGTDKKHLRLYCDSYQAVGFSLAEKYLQTELPGVMTGYGYPSENHYRGQTYKQFTLLDFEADQAQKGQ